MHAKPEQRKTSIVPALFKVLVGTIGVFAILTVCFYHNELDVDGNLTLGFPWIFYKEGAVIVPILTNKSDTMNLES